jgi:hypothetical protein
MLCSNTEKGVFVLLLENSPDAVDTIVKYATINCV